MMVTVNTHYVSRANLPSRKLAAFNKYFTLDGAFPLIHSGHMEIYKIFRADEWAAFQKNGVTDGAPIDLIDGYIHMSTAEQVVETAAKHFANVEGLVLLGIDADALGDDLRWEVSRGGALFPHLYRALNISDIGWHKPLPLGAEGHDFPDDIL